MTETINMNTLHMKQAHKQTGNTSTRTNQHGHIHNNGTHPNEQQTTTHTTNLQTSMQKKMTNTI